MNFLQKFTTHIIISNFQKLIFGSDKNKKNILIKFTVFFLLFVFFSWSYYFFCTQGTYKFYEFQQGTYYHALALAFERGMLGIPNNGPGADWSYYKGVNYLYFGPLPVVFWFIFKYVFHILISFTKLTLLFAIINLFCFYILLIITNKFIFPKSTPFFLKILFFSIYGLGPLYFLSARYFVYETAIIFGSVFMVVSFLLFFLYINYKTRSIIKDAVLLFFSGVFLAFSFFSRVNLILALFPFIFFFIYKEYSEKNNKAFAYTFYEIWFRLTIFLIPILIGILIYSYYNFARFNNPFEFGIKYSAQQSPEDHYRLISNKSISFNYFILNITQLIRLIPKISLNLPFIVYIKPDWLVGKFPKLLNIENTSSLFFSSPLLLFIFYIPIGIMKKFVKRSKSFVNLTLIIVVLIGTSIFGLFFMGYTRRYYQDYYFLLTLLSFVGIIFFFEDYVLKFNKIKKITFYATCLILIGWTFIIALNLNCQIAFRNDYARCLNNYNKPSTYIPLN